MKNYRGMYKNYFDIKDKGSVPEVAAALRNSISAITPDFMIKESVPAAAKLNLS